VDITGSVRSDVTAPGFTPWFMASDLTGQSASHSFTNYTYTYNPDTGLPTSTNINLIIPCTVTMTVPASSDSTHFLTANYANKNGNSTSTDPNSGWRLSEDGCWAHWKDDTIPVDQPITNGGALQLTISGLPAGVHTITTYHNDPWGNASGGTWHGTNVMSRCVISVNSTSVFTNTPTLVATNDSKCGFAFFYVTNSIDNQPVVINFDPDHSSVLDFVILNGFEIDRPSPPGTSATAIFPSPGDEHIFANNDVPLPGRANAGFAALQWQPAGFALTNYLYFGTSSNAVLNATTASTEYQGESVAVAGTTNSFNVTNLNSALTYFWRVDQLDVDNGVTNLVTGNVWEFRTRHLGFPTAEGYGRFSRGGRGGVVIEVTNLNDSGPGSYRAAVQATGPRTIVFRVSGLIRLNGPCVIGNGTVTVAGQTAPGDGICLANWRAGMTSCSDVTMRFMRCRLGDASQQAMDGIGLGNANNSIIDHCSISWTMDEASSSRQSGAVGSRSAMNSFQHNIISEPLQHSYHYNDAERAATGCTNCYQPHAFAASISGEIASYHHNLIAHSTDRNWSLAGGLDQSANPAGSLDIRNNVVYNWTSRTTDGGVARANYENNYYESYSSNPSAQYFLKADTPNTNQQYYMTGNVMTGVSGQGDVFTDNWKNGGYYQGAAGEALQRVNAEFYPSYVDTQTASNAYKIVMSDSGCNLPARDLIDIRVVGEVLDHTVHYEGTNGPTYTIGGVLQDARGPNSPGIIDSQTDVHDYTNDIAQANYSPNYPWGPYATYNVQLDTDHDGLPDWWEAIKGLNTNSAPGDFSDANIDLQGDGYTELERYLNWLALPHYDCTNGATLNIDLTQFTRGFTNGTHIYAVFSAAGGVVGLSGATAQYTPNIGVDGLGSFNYSVTDASGFSYTNTINIHIISDGVGLTNAPAAPTGLVATPGNAQVSLTWSSSATAANYRVKRSTTSGGPYSNIATNAATSFTDSTVLNGTTYYYVVSAVNVIGESSDSTEASATPQLPLPSTPTGLNATASSGQVALSWTASTGGTNYIVKSSTVNNGLYNNIATNATTHYTNSGLVNGTTYYYVVSAVNAAGESANSAQVSATPQIPAPTGLSAVATNAQVSLNWTASAGATNYITKRSTINGGPYTDIATNASTSYVNTGLVNGVTYFYVVSALGAGGESANSSQTSATPIGGGTSALYGYEGFNYTANTSVANQSGGLGWGATWGNASDPASALATNAATGLSYGNSTVQLTTSGGSLVVGNPSGPSSTTAQIQRRLPNTLTNILHGGGSIWISFLYQNLQSSKGSLAGFRETGIRLMSGATTNAAGYSNRDGTDKLDAGSPNTYPSGANFDELALFVAPTYSHNGYTTPRGTNPSNVVFVVMRLDVDVSTNLDTAYTWFFRNGDGLGGEPSTGSALVYTNADLSGVNALRFQAGNGNSNGSNACWALDEIRVGGTFADVAPVTVLSSNTAPVLPAIADRTINAGVNLLITNAATDSDVPAQTLAYTLQTAPTNAVIGISNGVLNWRPLVTQADTTNQFSVVVTDNGTPSLSATQSFNVIVNPLLAASIDSVVMSNAQVSLTVNGQSGPDYGVQVSTNLVDWSMLFITNSPAVPFTWTDTNAAAAPIQFYRIKAGPPLP
jgi:fibronectin type 3 domain-containing protein